MQNLDMIDAFLIALCSGIAGYLPGLWMAQRERRRYAKRLETIHAILKNSSVPTHGGME
jgi:hypothetical protein